MRLNLLRNDQRLIKCLTIGNISNSVDHITIPSRLGKGVLRRVNEVFDCWFESGAMPYAQCHYPFEVGSKTGLSALSRIWRKLDCLWIWVQPAVTASALECEHEMLSK